MNRFIKTGSMVVLCTAASVALAASNEKVLNSNDDFFDNIYSYINLEQTEIAAAEPVSESRNTSVYSGRNDRLAYGDDFFDGINEYMAMEESEFAAAEPVSEGRNTPVYSGRKNRISGGSDYFDATLYEPSK